jgi:hypothetical protein
MSDKTFLGKEINFNKPPVMWAGMEVYPGNGATSNLYGTLNVIKSPDEPTIPNINTDGNLKVNLNATINKNLRVNGQSTFNKDVKMNKKLLLANCGNVAKRIDRADKLPSSDQTLKTNITPITSALSKVLQLNGVEFDFIDGADTGYLKKHQIGLIAQDVNKVIPEVVGKNNDGTLGVSYQHLVAVLIEAIKEQQQEIEDLKKIVSEGK